MALLLQDLPAFALTLFGLLALVAMGEVLHRRGVLGPEATRRIVHAGVGVSVALTPLLFVRPLLVYVLAALFVVGNGLAARRGWLRGMHGVDRASVGTVVFPLALLVLLPFTWSLGPGRIYALQLAFLVLAFADPAASWAGQRVPRPGAFGIGRAKKTVAGSAAFFGVAALLMLVYLRAVEWPWADALACAAGGAAVLTSVEALGRGGWDNFFVPVVAVLWLVFFHEHPYARAGLLQAVAAGAAFAWLCYRLRFLDLSGAVAAGLLALSVLGVGGAAWAVPSLVFFVLSSLLSKVGKARKAASGRLTEKGSVRDAGQVYANGGVGWALLLMNPLVPSGLWYWGFVGAFAAAAADTWATEVGTLFRGRPRLVTTWRPVSPGTSGAVSVPGTLGSVAGAASVGLAALPYLPTAATPAASVLVVVGGGVAASFLDSLLGATVQARFRDPSTGELTERSGRGELHFRIAGGFSWMNNDRVNLACTAAGALLAAAFAAMTQVF